MLRYVIRRLLWSALGLFIVAFITFSLMHLVPGGPWDRQKALDPQVIENLNKKYGLDRPFIVQFGSYIWNTLHGDLGVSYQYQDRGVTQILAQGIPITATLGISAFLLALLVGLPLGMAAALKQNSPVDYISVVFATIFASVPGFVLGIFLIIIFAVKLHWVPTGGWGSTRQLILPAISLAALPAAYIARISRASVLDVIRQDYVRTARAKGLGERRVIFRHAFRNALLPIITNGALEMAFLFSGAIVTETIFSLQGMGYLFYQGLLAHDYFLLMGIVLIGSILVVFFNLVADVLYAVADPRIRYD